MFCPRCGNKIPSKYASCPYCGYKEKEEDNQDEDNIIEVTPKMDDKKETEVKIKKTKKLNLDSKYLNDIKLFFLYFLMLFPIAFIVVSYIVFKLGIYFFVCLGICAIIEIFAVYLYISNKNKLK